MGRVGAALIAVALLAGCFETAPLREAASRAVAPVTAVAGPATVAVLGGAVTVAGPAGYCIDAEATRETDIEAFVLLVRCRGTVRAAPILSAAITGTPAPDVGDPEAMRALAAFLDTPPGRAQLSRSGDPRDVTLERATYSDNAIWLLIRDRGNPDSFDETYWRAVLPVAGRVVTLSVLAAENHPFETEAGLALLTRFVMRMRQANAG